MNQLVQVQVKIDSVDSNGGIDKTWLDEGEQEWAEVLQLVPGINSEHLYSGQLRTVATYQVTMRFYDGLSPAMNRIMWLGNVLDIHAVDSSQKGGRAESILICQQGLTNG